MLLKLIANSSFLLAHTSGVSISCNNLNAWIIFTGPDDTIPNYFVPLNASTIPTRGDSRAAPTIILCMWKDAIDFIRCCLLLCSTPLIVQVQLDIFAPEDDSKITLPEVNLNDLMGGLEDTVTIFAPHKSIISIGGTDVGHTKGIFPNSVEGKAVSCLSNENIGSTKWSVVVLDRQPNPY